MILNFVSPAFIVCRRDGRWLIRARAAASLAFSHGANQAISTPSAPPLESPCTDLSPLRSATRARRAADGGMQPSRRQQPSMRLDDVCAHSVRLCVRILRPRAVEMRPDSALSEMRRDAQRKKTGAHIMLVPPATTTQITKMITSY